MSDENPKVLKRVEYEVQESKYPFDGIWESYNARETLRDAKKLLAHVRDGDGTYRIIKRTITEEIVK